MVIFGKFRTGKEIRGMHCGLCTTSRSVQGWRCSLCFLLQKGTRTMQAMPNKTLYRYSPAMYTRRFLQETIFLRSPSCLAVSVVYCLTVGQKCLVQNSCPQKSLWHKKPPIPDEERGRVAIRACPASAFPRRRLCAEARQECLCAVDNGARTGRSQYSGLPGAGAVRICRSLRDRRAVPRGSSCP